MFGIGYVSGGIEKIDYLREQVDVLKSVLSKSGFSEGYYFGAVSEDYFTKTLDSISVDDELIRLLSQNSSGISKGLGWSESYENLRFKHLVIGPWHHLSVSFLRSSKRTGFMGIIREEESVTDISLSGTLAKKLAA